MKDKSGELMVIQTRAAQSYHFARPQALSEEQPSGTAGNRRIFWGRRSLSNPTDKPQLLVFFLGSAACGSSDWRTGSDHVISPQPVQQGPTRSDSTGPSHPSLSECGVPSIHQLCQALPPPRPETAHIQASLHSSHMLEPLTATLMFLFIRPFITLEVKIQMH